MKFDYTANLQLANASSELDSLIQKCNQHNGDYVVARSSEKLAIMPEFAANVRNDVDVIYSNRNGYSFGG